MNISGVPQLGPAEIPFHAMQSEQAFVDWMMYQAPWREIMPMLVSCPLCAAVVSVESVEVMRHALFHVATVVPR